MKRRTNANGMQMKCKRNENANAKMVNENGETLSRNDRNDKNEMQTERKCKR